MRSRSFWMVVAVLFALGAGPVAASLAVSPTESGPCLAKATVKPVSTPRPPKNGCLSCPRAVAAKGEPRSTPRPPKPGCLSCPAA